MKEEKYYFGVLNFYDENKNKGLDELHLLNKLYEEKAIPLHKRIRELEHIIKEVREYIQDRYDGEVLTHTFDKDNVKELLEILDKVGE